MLHLEPITAQNWKQAVLITTDGSGQRPLDERWVTGSAYSMLQALYEPQWQCRAIADGDAVVGLALFGIWPERGIPLLCRFAIDVSRQGQGLGRRALPLVVAEMRALYGCRDIYVTVDPRNERAARLYRSAGFVLTGEKDEEEDILLLPG